MDDIGALSAQGAAQPTDQAQVKVMVDANAGDRDAARLEQRHEIVNRLGRVFDQQQRDIDAARLERGQENGQVTFGSGDAGRLDDVGDFHKEVPSTEC